MTEKHRSKSEIEKHRRRISELYLKGMLQEEIATEIGVSQPTVSRDLKAIQKVWQKETLHDFNEAKAKELERVDILEREYWQAWQRSCEDAEIIRQEGKSKTKDNKPDKVVRTVKGQTGDPRFLQGVQWCIERRCKILGIDAPIRQELGGLGGGPIIIQGLNIAAEQIWGGDEDNSGD